MEDLSAIPKYNDLMYPTLRAVEMLGGSGTAVEITAKVIEFIAPSDEVLAVTYDSRPKSVLLDRIDWARSYCKLGGVLESPTRGVFLVTALGRELLAVPDGDAQVRLREIDRQVRSERRRGADASGGGVEEAPSEDSDRQRLDERILARLHRLSPAGFEEFCLFLLRQFGLELTRVGGPGDEGIDGIGTAPLSPVLSATVAVQAKRWDPSTVVSRDRVALFQRDASAAGAERAVMVTLGRFSDPARKASQQANPTVDLIDGQRLCQLIRDQRVGLVEELDEAWFDRFA